MTGPYDDMLNMPHPTSRQHPRMSRSDRAAQFAPFAALSGHSAALVETARLTERRIELDEDVKAALDLKQQMLMDRIDEHPDVAVTWFQPRHAPPARGRPPPYSHRAGTPYSACRLRLPAGIGTGRGRFALLLGEKSWAASSSAAPVLPGGCP